MLRFLCLCFSFAAPLAAQTLRQDLQAPLQKLLCQANQAIPSTVVLWQQGIYETQLDAAFIRSSDAQQDLNPDDIARVAADQAAAQQLEGYAYGLCSPREAWIVATPAGAPLVEKRADGIALNIQAMRDHCKTVSLHYAKLRAGAPKKLTEIQSRDETRIVLHPDLLEPGTIGLTCDPGRPTEAGPELWSLLPIHTIPSETIPFFSNDKREGSLALISWLQKVRNAHGLKPLHTDVPILKQFANQLVKETSIRHPRPELIRQRKFLKEKRIELLGENRVKATSDQQMAWLLWYSPTHRQLLLHKNANSLGFDFARLPKEKLLVLVLAKIQQRN